MSRLEIPVTGKALWATGDRKVWVDLPLDLKDSSGHWRRRIFRVDTGTEITTFPAYDAQRLDLPMPQQPVAGAIHVQTSLPFRSGYLRFRIPGMDQTEYVSSCLFLGDLATPVSLVQPAATAPRRLFQPLGLLGQLRFVMDHDPASGTAYGTLLVEKK